MFEQSVVESKRVVVSRRRAVTLPVSIAMHIIALSGAVFAAVWNVDFPTAPPSQVETLDIQKEIEIPADRRRQEPQKPSSAVPVVARATVAPTVVPETTPEVAPRSIPVAELELPGAVDGGFNDGDGSGSLDGIDGGVGAGPAQETEHLLHRPGGDVKPPVVVQRVEPVYPPLALKMRIQGMAVVECVIDRDGNIRSVKTVSASHELFRSAAESAVSRWRFKPGTLGGKPVDVLFHLTVHFRMNS